MNAREYDRALKRHMKKMAEEMFAPIVAQVRPVYQKLRRKHGAKKAKVMLNQLFPPFYAPPMRVGTHIE